MQRSCVSCGIYAATLSDAPVAGSAYHAAPLLLPLLDSTAKHSTLHVLPVAVADAVSALALAALVCALRKQRRAPPLPGTHGSFCTSREGLGLHSAPGQVSAEKPCSLTGEFLLSAIVLATFSRSKSRRSCSTTRFHLHRCLCLFHITESHYRCSSSKLRSTYQARLD